MKTAKLIIFALSVAAASSTQLSCEYVEWNVTFTADPQYTCSGNVTTRRTDYLIDSVSGSHLDGFDNDKVIVAFFYGSSMEVMPRNLTTYFKNFRMLAFLDVVGLPNLKRSDFYDFTHLTHFALVGSKSVTNIPRDTFFDMTKLEILGLDSLENMENLHADLLMNLRNLVVFSATGPNQINQISPGFFRNQMETLKDVDFSKTNLVRVGHSVFANLQVFNTADFTTSSCLDGVYKKKEDLTTAIRQNCQDVLTEGNAISRRQNFVSSDSRE